MTLSDIDAGDVAVFVWTLLQIGLTALYGVRSRWRTTDAGRILFTSFACTSIALTQVSVTLLTASGYWARDVIRPCAYGLGILGTIVMIHLLLRMQSKDAETRHRARGRQL